MQVFDKTGLAEACTKHSTNPVPCILFDPSFDGSYRLHQPRDGDDKALMPGLSHLAATIYAMLGKAPPADLNSSLIETV